MSDFQAPRQVPGESGVPGTPTNPDTGSQWWEQAAQHKTEVLSEQANGPSLAPTAAAATPRARRSTAALLSGALVVSLAAGTAGGFLGYRLADGADEGTPAVAAPVNTGSGDVEPAEGSVAAVAAAVLPAVVNIDARSQGGAGNGSGFVIRSDGYILTNNHVVDGAQDLTVTFSDGSSAPAEIVGSDAGYDIAVIKVDRTELPVVAIGSSDALNVGDATIAVGSPLGLSGTVTSGIVSALNRPVTAGGSGETSFINAIQTDAAINPGNSGGPLLNGAGEVIGINSAIASLGSSAGGSAGSIGLGFAIPIDVAYRLAEELITTGSVTTPAIGILVDGSADGRGAGVAEVTPGGAAEAAGIQQGDVITAVDGARVTDATELIVAIRSNAVGETVTVTLERDGAEQTVDVTLQANPDPN